MSAPDYPVHAALSTDPYDNVSTRRRQVQGDDQTDVSGSRRERGYKIEFTPGYLNCIPELTILFLSCLLPVLSIAGKGVLTTLLCGVVMAYIFDYTNSRKMTLAAVWMTTSSVVVGLVFSNINGISQSWLSAFVILNSCFLLFLVGLFATVQFTTLQVEVPEFALICERLLLGLTPIICLPLLYSTILMLIGSQVGAFLFSIVCCALHRTFYTLRKSALKTALHPAARKEEFINGRAEVFTFTLIIVILPMMLHSVSHPKDAFSGPHILGLFTLISIPIFYLFLDPPRSLWFLHSNPFVEPENRDVIADDVLNLTEMRIVIVGGSYFVGLHWIIYRLLFGRFAYLFTTHGTTQAAIFICLAAYCGSITLFLAIRLASSGTGKTSSLWYVMFLCSLMASVSFTYALGVGGFGILQATCASSALICYCVDQSRMADYFLFAVTASLFLIVWMHRSFSFLQVDFKVYDGAKVISLQTLSFHIYFLFILQCVIFPVARRNYAHKSSTLFLLLIQQVLFLSVIEHILYSQPESVYPSYCVMATSLWGAYFTKTLWHNNKLGKGEAATLAGLYLGKFYLFAMVTTLPDKESELYDHDNTEYSLMVTHMMCAVMCSIVMQLYYERLQKKRRTKTGPAGFVYMICAVAVAMLSRNSIVLALLELLTQDGEVSSGRLIGLSLMYAGILSLPMSALVPSGSVFRRVTAGILFVGAVIAFLDPSTTEDSSLEVGVYTPPFWAIYIGILAIIAWAITLLGGFSALPDSGPVRMLWWGVVSLSCSMSYCGLFYPYPTLLVFISVTAVFSLVALGVDLVHYNLSAQDEDSNSVWGAYTCALVSMLVTLVSAQYFIPEEFDAFLHYEIIMQRQDAVLVLSVGVNLLTAGLLKLKLVESPVLIPKSVERVQSMREKLHSGTHFGLLSNVAIIQVFITLLVLKVDFGVHDKVLPVLMSPLFLLMSDDGFIFVGLNNPEHPIRYFTPFVASILSILYPICMDELPQLLNRSVMTFSIQGSICAITISIACGIALDLFEDPTTRRQSGRTGKPYSIIALVVFFFLSWTEAIRILVCIVLAGSTVLLFNDSIWAAKWVPKL